MRTVNRLFIAVLFLTSALFASAMKVDGSHSSVGFEIRHMMISTVDGKFNSYSGEVEMDLESKNITNATARIDAKSIDTANDRRDNHLRDPDFFEVDTYPHITFEMTKYEANGDKGKMTGNMTIKDVTKEITLDTTVTGVISDRGTTRAGIELRGAISREDFGLTYNRALEFGGVAIGDEVKLVINLQVISQ